MEPLSATLLKTALLAYVIGAGTALLAARRQKLSATLSFGSAILGALAGFSSGFLHLISAGSGPGPRFEVIPGPMATLPLSVHLDALSAFFLMLVSVLALAISIYSLGYAKGFYGRKSITLLGALFNVLLLATSLVAVADNAFFFLVAWEIMALTAYCLVSYEHEQKETRNAGVLYLVMSHIGTGCIILGFLLLFQSSGGYGFAGFHDLGDKMSPGLRHAAFLLFFFGFGTKCGIVPLHIWLPAAHPVAPSNVSAFLSAILIKTGIYGITRVCFDFLGTPPMWWGVMVLAIGTASAVLGVLYALMEHDLKRLLAYHSIENIGIILMGLGASLMFLHTGHMLLAGLALLAGLYHTVNHATFKGLLFLGAGAVLHSTHTRNMEEMGGLIKRMPKTALFFLIGAVAISALPPLNGFVSEWLTYQALLHGFGTTSSLVRLMFPIGGALLALTGALAAACFVKAFGITFLAQPRSEHAAQAHEASPTMIFGMGLLALLCIVLGLFPIQFITLMDPVTSQLVGTTMSSHLSVTDGLVLAARNEYAGTVSPLAITLVGLCLLPIPAALWFVFGRRTKVHIGPTWDCGLRGLTPQMEYTATGFSKPIRMIFRTLFRPHREIQAEFEFSPYFATNIRFESHIEETFEQRLYRPLNRLIFRFSRRMRALQAGSIQAYLIYIFITLLLLLMFAL